MAITLGEYAGFTSAVIKARADFPKQSNMTDNGTSVTCTKLRVSHLADVIDCEYNGVGAINVHTEVNQWSWFGPGRWIYSGGEVVYDSPPAPPDNAYKLSDFAGYNHNAKAPYGNTMDGITASSEGGNIGVATWISLGEIDWRTIPLIPNGGIAGVGWEIKHGSTPVASGAFDYTDDLQQTGVNVSETVYHAAGTAGSYTVRFYFTTEAADDYTEICPIPNIPTYTIPVTLYYPAYIYSVEPSSILQAQFPDCELAWAESYSSVNQNTDTIYIEIFGMDNDNDGDGDKNIWSAEVYVSKNYKLWYKIAEQSLIIPGGSIFLNNEPLIIDIEDNDVVYVILHSAALGQFDPQNP